MANYSFCKSFPKALKPSDDELLDMYNSMTAAQIAEKLTAKAQEHGWRRTLTTSSVGTWIYRIQKERSC